MKGHLQISYREKCRPLTIQLKLFCSVEAIQDQRSSDLEGIHYNLGCSIRGPHFSAHVFFTGIPAYKKV